MNNESRASLFQNVELHETAHQYEPGDAVWIYKNNDQQAAIVISCWSEYMQERGRPSAAPRRTICVSYCSVRIVETNRYYRRVRATDLAPR